MFSMMCPFCKKTMPVSYGMALYFVHLIDDHWPLIEKIHATTGNPAARDRLNSELLSEMGYANEHE